MTTKLNLSSLLEEMNSWKAMVKRKNEAIENFKNQIKEAKENIDTLESTNSTLLKEISQFNKVISTLHQSLSQIEECATDKKRLVEDKMKLEMHYLERENKLQFEINELEENIEKLKENHKKDIEKHLLEIDTKVSLKLQNYCMTLREKENIIIQLEDDILKLKSEKNQELLKMKIECEEKINKMKSKIVKHKGSLHFNNCQSNDIFRQKYIEKEREAKEESSNLKKEIESLQKEIILLSSSNNTISIFKANSSSDSITELNSTEESKSMKRQKLNGNLDTSANKNIPQRTHIAHNFRKKLFNLDMNYFNQ